MLTLNALKLLLEFNVDETRVKYWWIEENLVVIENELMGHLGVYMYDAAKAEDVKRHGKLQACCSWYISVLPIDSPEEVIADLKKHGIAI